MDKFYRIFVLSERHLEESEYELTDIESRNDFIILPVYTP